MIKTVNTFAQNFKNDCFVPNKHFDFYEDETCVVCMKKFFANIIKWLRLINSAKNQETFCLCVG